MNNDPIALQIADALLRNNRQSINIEAAAELRAQHNALINADDTRNRLIRRVTELEARIAELVATKNECGAGAMCCYQASKLGAAEARIIELEAQLAHKTKIAEERADWIRELTKKGKTQ